MVMHGGPGDKGKRPMDWMALVAFLALLLFILLLVKL